MPAGANSNKAVPTFGQRLNRRGTAFCVAAYGIAVAFSNYKRFDAARRSCAGGRAARSSSARCADRRLTPPLERISLAGISLVLLNSMLKPLYTDLGFDKNVGGGVAAGVMYLGVAVGGLVAGPFEDASGKYAQVWVGAFFMLGNLLCALSTDHKLCWGGSFDGCVADMILTGRLITGLGSGLALVVSPR